MAFDEEAFMRLDSASEESLQERDDESVEEAHDGHTTAADPDTDNKLMEYLLKGYVLSSACCRTCSTPLINNMSDKDEIVESCFGNQEKHPAGRPVKRVPFCVSCATVIVKTKDELQILWQPENKHLMAEEGAVILDFDDDSVNPVFPATDEIVPAQLAGEETPIDNFAPIKYESGDGLLVISDNGGEDEPTGGDVEVELDTSPEPDEVMDTSPKEEKLEIDFDMIDYKKRRQIATKVLGAKMIQGYSLKESQCTQCAMPLMEKPDMPELECVVCPVLVKKIKKKMAEKSANEEKLMREEDMCRKEEEQQKQHQKMIEDARKKQLEEQLNAEKEYLREIKSTRVAAANIDLEEKRMLEEIRLAKEARAKEEERLLAEERVRQLSAKDDDRNRLIKELRIAREEREKERKRQETEKAQAEDKLIAAKERELEHDNERRLLVEELRIAKEQKRIEAQRRLEEAKAAAEKHEESSRFFALKEKEHHQTIALKEKEHQQTIALKEKEHQETMEQFNKAQDLIKEEASRREEELAKAEAKARKSEAELNKWREMSNDERRTAEELRENAEEMLLDAEEALVEAEELALEAQTARETGYGDHGRLIEMYRNAEELRMDAEAEHTVARNQLAEAEQRLESCNNMQRSTENRLAMDVEAAQDNLKAAKTKVTREAREGQQRLQHAENQMLQTRFGEVFDVAAAGEDWEARRLLGKKVLAKEVMSGWTVLPEYCSGRMCNFTPLIFKGRAIKCVVCEGTGNGRDGFYDEISSQALLDDTMSFVSRRNRFNRISSANRGSHNDANARRDAASREVGRRILDGWQLTESPCPSCQMPLMCEAFGTPEICICCDPDENIEFGDDDALDEMSCSSRQSITLDIPEGFDPSDPDAMAKLVARATTSVKSGLISRGRASAPRNRIPGSIGGRQRSVSRSRGSAPLPRSVSRSSRSRGSAPRPSPESRNALPSMRRGRRSRRAPEPLMISTDGFNDDDASQLSDDVSVAKSVASHTLDAILSKIQDCKAQLNGPDDDDISIAQKSEAASLIQKLSAAAIAVKNLEATAE